MSKLIKHDESLIVLTLSKKDAANVIATLAAQLADSNLTNNHSGACHHIRLNNSYLTFIIE